MFHTTCPASARPFASTSAPTYTDKADFVAMIKVEKVEYDFDRASSDEICNVIDKAVRG